MDYKNILNIHNQMIVDELYKRLKTEEENESLEKAYHEIKEKNKFQYYRYLDQIKLFFSIILQMILYLLIIISGSTILGSAITIYGKFAQNKNHTTITLGRYINNHFIHIPIKEITGKTAGISSKLVFYSVIGTSTIVALILLLLFLFLMFKPKKEKINNVKEINAADAYINLECTTEDDLNYIRKQFVSKLNKNKKNQDKYYQSYLFIVEHYESPTLSFKTLESNNKVKVIIQSIKTILFNICGILGGALTIAGLFLLTYLRFFYFIDTGDPDINVKSYSLTQLLKHMPFGKAFINIMNSAHSIMTPFHHYYQNYSKELSQVISLLLLFIILYIIYQLVVKRIPEIKRQYHRILFYYSDKRDYKFKSHNKYHNSFLLFELLIFLVFMYYILEKISA